jgi:hypothetical protein
MNSDRHATIERSCEYCENLFMARVERVNNGQGKFCSKSCYNSWIKEHPNKLLGKENGKKYWDGNAWKVHWYDDLGKIHITTYQKWWWETNKGELQKGLYVVLKDGNPENISPENFVVMNSKEFGAVRGQKLIGHTYSEESKKKMSASRTGKPLSLEHRKNLSESLKMRWKRGDYVNTVFVDISGDKNPGWRGGAGQEYPQEFNRALKNFVWERDNSVCQICGRHVSPKGVVGHVHHIDGYKEHNEYDNLILLCIHCHGKIHRSKDVSSPVIMAFRSKLYWNQ